MLPGGSPLLPANHMPLSTWGLGAALKAAQEAGVPKLSVIHFDNCFNMAVEVLHTVAPSAEYATGYPNYNFFTAGEGYPGVFAKLAQQGTASAQELAHWFADANRQILEAKGNHPTLGCVVRLARLHTIAECVDDLADALLAALWHLSCARDTAGFIQALQRHSVELANDGETDLLLGAMDAAAESPRERFDLLLAQGTLWRMRGDAPREQGVGHHQIQDRFSGASIAIGMGDIGHELNCIAGGQQVVIFSDADFDLATVDDQIFNGASWMWLEYASQAVPKPQRLGST